jgi:hypothetical protein
MLTHIVVFRFDDDADADGAAKRLRAMEGRVPSLRSITVGRNAVASEFAYDLALVTTFDDVAGLEAYQVDPVHLEAAIWIRERVAARAVVDFES